MSISVGIDVAKDNLVVSFEKGSCFEFANSAEGLGQLERRLPAGAEVHLEASGGYERLAHRTLERSGFKVSVHNPLKARRLAQALSTGVKTDPVDARHLARAAKILPAHPAKSAEREALADHSRAIDTIKTTLAEYRKRIAQPGLDEAARTVFSCAAAALKEQCELAEKAFVARIKASQLATSYRLLLTVPGIGPVAARVCICELPENFASVSPSSIAAYAGLAPIDQSSGNHHGRKRIAHGNKRLRTGLYMGALAIVQTEPWATITYRRLIEAKKPHQVALVAVMRKLLLRAVAVLKRQTAWVST